MRSELLRILARLTLECSVGEEAGAWAVAALTADEDTDAIRVLAGFSANTPREEVTPWLRRVAHDLGVRLPTREESRWILVVFQAREARDLALAIADGRLGVVEGSWKLRDLSFARAPVDDELRALFMPFVAVTTETDHLPVGEDRVNWNPDVLRAKDEGIRSYEESIRAQMLPHCRAFAARVDRDTARLGEFFNPAKT